MWVPSVMVGAEAWSSVPFAATRTCVLSSVRPPSVVAIVVASSAWIWAGPASRSDAWSAAAMRGALALPSTWAER